MSQLRLTVIGGGTGSFTILQSLKELTPQIQAVVNMCDDGGSTGLLRDELGVLPPGDARQCLVALSEAPEVRDLFSFRFPEGSLKGHSLGNIIISGLELQHGSFEKAIDVASEVLRIRGRVVPVALGDHKLAMKDAGKDIIGQHACDTHTIIDHDARVRLVPASPINPQADKAIREANIVVIAPGSFYTSLLPIFSVDGVAEALAETKAHVVFIANLVNKPTQTKGWHVVDYLKKLEEYIGKGSIDTVLYNTEKISDDLLSKYAADGEIPVPTDVDRFKEFDGEVIGADLVSHKITEQDPADTMIRRTYIRHDPQRVKEEVEKIWKTLAE